MPNNNHISDSRKVNDSHKPGNTEPAKAELPAQEHPGSVKPESPAAEVTPETVPPPAVEAPLEDKVPPGPTAEQPVTAGKDAPKDKGTPVTGKEAPPKEKKPPDKPLPEDKQTTIPGMEGPAPAGKVVDFSAARDGAAKDKPPEKATVPDKGRQPDIPTPRRGRPPKEGKSTPGKAPPRDKKSQGKEAGFSAPSKKKDSRTPGGVKSVPAVEPSVAEQPIEPKDATRAVKEEIVYLDLSELHAFKNHPFEVRDDAEMQALVESVKTGGVNQPALVRPREGGGYEIVAGHRRQKASELAGYRNMPCIVREMTDDEAILAMTDDNLRHREHILPMEKARALKQQVEAIKHQGVKLGEDDKDAGKRSTEVVGARNGINYKQVQRYIRLNELVPELQKMVDEKKLSFTPAVEISFIRPKNQQFIAVSIEGEQSAPSLSQAQKLRELDKDGKLNPDAIDGILSQEKKEVDKVILSTAELSKYFGKEITPRQMKEQILALLDEWKEKQPPEKKAELEK